MTMAIRGRDSARADLENCAADPTSFDGLMPRPGRRAWTQFRRHNTVHTFCTFTVNDPSTRCARSGQGVLASAFACVAAVIAADRALSHGSIRQPCCSIEGSFAC